MKRLKIAAVLGIIAATVSTSAHANELFGGLYVHDVDTPLSIAGIEKGMDVQIGWRGSRIGRTPLQPYVFGALNTSGKTSYAAAGISARFGRDLYVRPGLGIALHTGETDDFEREGRVALGSRVLFEPELAIGVQASDRLSIEGSWVHISHGQLFGRQNPGMDNFGVRLNLAL